MESHKLFGGAGSDTFPKFIRKKQSHGLTFGLWIMEMLFPGAETQICSI